MRILLTTLMSILLTTTAAFAQTDDTDSAHDQADSGDLVLTLKMGAPAPWTGTLISAGAAASMILSRTHLEDKCKLDIEHTQKLEESKCTRDKSVLEGENKLLKSYYEGVILAKDKHIKSLEDIKNPPPPPPLKFYETTTAYFTYGILAGAAIAIASTHFTNN